MSVSVVITNTKKGKVRNQTTYITKFSKKEREGDGQRGRRRKKERKEEAEEEEAVASWLHPCFVVVFPFLLFCVFILFYFIFFKVQIQWVASWRHPFFVIVFFLFSFTVFILFFFFGFKFNGKQGTVKTGLITVLRTVWSDRGLHGSLFLLIERFFRLKEPQKLTVQGFSGRTVRFGPGFKTLSCTRDMEFFVSFIFLFIFIFIF